MPWREGLHRAQVLAAGHDEGHACLLAGPGTGKTHVLTRHVLFLIVERGVPPGEILVLTFTRAAARELQDRIATIVGEANLPRIATLHSFALRQLLRNGHRLDHLPQPLRIADDWEERHIILEDLKAILGYRRINEAGQRFSELSADWETLAADQGNFTPDPAFIAAWHEHREIYGYTLRAELVYQLKRALQQVDDFDLETPIRHLIVDEYQDLNRCDLAVVEALAGTGATVYVAGDDDQSIYGFRKAHPDGIRRFVEQYGGARQLPLELCFRCDGQILALAQFVAELDPRRIPKRLRAQDGRDGGEVTLLRFRGYRREADAVADMCRTLVDRGHSPGEILILLRTDKYGVFSDPLREELERRDVPVASRSSAGPLEREGGEQVIAHLRLLANRNDHLAWRTLLQQRRNGIGEAAIGEIYNQCRNRSERFADAVRRIAEDPQQASTFGGRLRAEVQAIDERLHEIAEGLPEPEEAEPNDLRDAVRFLCEVVLENNEEREAIAEHVCSVVDTAQAVSPETLLTAVAVFDERTEQDRDTEMVNILSMHQAKGLTAETVFVVGVEDERLPGKATGEPGVGDERRLLFVSLTRAKHRLFITYCTRRTHRQMKVGRHINSPVRTLTRFLRDAPIQPQDGTAFAERYLTAQIGP